MIIHPLALLGVQDEQRRHRIGVEVGVHSRVHTGSVYV